MKTSGQYKQVDREPTSCWWSGPDCGMEWQQPCIYGHELPQNHSSKQGPALVKTWKKDYRSATAKRYCGIQQMYRRCWSYGSKYQHLQNWYSDKQIVVGTVIPDMVVQNTWVLYRLSAKYQNQPMDLLDFRQEICAEYRQASQARPLHSAK
jgi:hypothetical protein